MLLFVDCVNFCNVMIDSFYVFFEAQRRALFQASVVSVGQTDDYLSSVARKPMEISNLFKIKRDCFMYKAK